MTRVIATSPPLIIRNDTIAVVTGNYRGEHGLVVGIFRGMATVARPNGHWFAVPVDECEKKSDKEVQHGTDNHYLQRQRATTSGTGGDSGDGGQSP